MTDELERRREHNRRVKKLTFGVPAQPATPESEADPANPNRRNMTDEAMAAAAALERLQRDFATLTTAYEGMKIAAYQFLPPPPKEDV